LVELNEERTGDTAVNWCAGCLYIERCAGCEQQFVRDDRVVVWLNSTSIAHWCHEDDGCWLDCCECEEAVPITMIAHTSERCKLVGHPQATDTAEPAYYVCESCEVRCDICKEPVNGDLDLAWSHPDDEESADDDRRKTPRQVWHGVCAKRKHRRSQTDAERCTRVSVRAATIASTLAAAAAAAATDAAATARTDQLHSDQPIAKCEQ
jgi:hypothetical protein